MTLHCTPATSVSQGVAAPPGRGFALSGRRLAGSGAGFHRRVLRHESQELACLFLPNSAAPLFRRFNARYNPKVAGIGHQRPGNCDPCLSCHRQRGDFALQHDRRMRQPRSSLPLPRDLAAHRLVAAGRPCRITPPLAYHRTCRVRCRRRVRRRRWPWPCGAGRSSSRHRSSCPGSRPSNTRWRGFRRSWRARRR